MNNFNMNSSTSFNSRRSFGENIFKNNNLRGLGIEGPSSTSAVSGFDPNLNISGIGDINTDLSSVSSDIIGAGRGISNEDIEKFRINRPENEFETPLKSAISGLQDYAAGESQVDRTIANRYLQNLRASQGAQSMAQAQRIASSPFMTPGAKAAAAMEFQRLAGTQESELMGKLAEQSQERAFTASQKLTDVLQNAASYKEAQFQADVQVISQDLDRELRAKVAAGEISKAEVALKLDKYGIDLNAVIAEKNFELDKLKHLDDYDLTFEQIEQAKINNKLTEINFWQPTAANAVLELKNTNPDATVDDLINDDYAYQAATNTYKAITGKDEKPSESWLQSFMDTVKTQSETEKETVENALNTIRNSLIDAGVDAGIASEVTGKLRLFKETGGLIQTNQDGSVSFLGIDGKPIRTFGGTDEPIWSSTQVQNNIYNAYGKEFIDDAIEGIVSGDIPSKETFIQKLKNQVGANNFSNEDKTVAERFYDDVELGNIKSTKISSIAEEVTFTGNVWGSTANKILDSSNKSDEKDRQYIIEERVSNIINDPALNKKVGDEDTYNELLDNASEWVPAVDYREGSIYSSFTNSMDVGTIIKLDGKVYRVMTDPTRTTTGDQHIRLYDFKQGKTVVLGSASKDDKYYFAKT